MTDVPVRDAATVVLLRDGGGARTGGASTDSGIEVWLLTRVRQMAFAAGMSVFPGGRVDVADADLPFAADAGSDVATRFGCGHREALALLGAAVRETFEETGVLLSVPRADLAASRSDVEAGTISFGDLLRAHGLTVDVSGLAPWARWITPPGEVRRYDTRFFVAALPDGAAAQDLTSESASADWVPVAEALAQVERGERHMMPPTIVTLAAVAAFGSVAEVLDASPQRSLDAISPAIHHEGDRIVAELPDGARYELPRALFA